MSLIFKTTRGRNPKGRLEPKDKRQWAGLVKALVRVLGTNRGELPTRDSVIQGCLTLLKEDPHFIPAMEAIVECYTESNVEPDPQLMRILAKHVPQVRELIPEGFGGSLDEYDELTGCFVCIHLFFLLALVLLGRYDEALGPCRDRLAWFGDPVFLTLEGNIHIMQGDLQAATRIFGMPSLPTPFESAYSQGLLLFLGGQYEGAITALREAMILQPYVAEITLAGEARANPSWNLPDNESMLENARAYCSVSLGRRIWRKRRESLLFLHWLFNCPEMLCERGKALSILQGASFHAPAGFDKADRLYSNFMDYARAVEPSFAEGLLRKIPFGGTMVHAWEAYPEDDMPDPDNWQGDALEEEVSCGDCVECEIFDECHGAAADDFEGCDECDECELEGFCQGDPVTPPGGKPPSTH
ncbi:MAG: hypothetical protein LBF40_06635 [Deltaproteobacteria bacterium]|jgi:hypothetical protein|nr:hypothetical protein [Deltaproteobacteria bacterium]